MSNLLTRMMAQVGLQRRRRSLAHVLASLSDHHLRDIGIERNFIDDAVVQYVPSLPEEQDIGGPPG